jgi:hypothetical protein
MKDRAEISVEVANEAVLTSLRKPVAPSSPRSPWIARGVAALIAVGFGAFATVQFWPQVWGHIGSDTGSSSLGEPLAVPAQQSAVPASHRQSTLGVLGTDSSLAVDPQVLVLVDTRPGANSMQGTAALGTDPRNPQVYVAGALLANGARLTEIYDNRVVLERDGQRVTIHKIGAAVFTRISSQGTGSATSALPAADRDKFVNGAAELANIGSTTRPTRHDAAGAALPTNSAPSPIWTALRAQPKYVGDAIAGFELAPGEQSGLYSQAGLQAGDLLVAIDGAPALDPISIDSFLDSLHSGAAHKVTVVRSGVRHELAVDGAALVRTSPPLSSAPGVGAPPG